jgi:D-alanyl-D-alanine carboxypeptidase
MANRAAGKAAVIIASVLPVTCAVAQVVELSDEEVVTRTKAVIDWAMERRGAVGLSVAVARDGTILVEEGAGIADLEFSVPVNSETSFRIGSVTKQYTAASIMKLAERGELSIDDDIGDYVPDFESGDRAITIRNLLNHTSGIPNYTAQPEFFGRGSPVNLTDGELLEFIDGVPFDFEPNEGWNYSNTGYYLLGMIIEAADGRPYDRFVQEEFFDPLGLTRTRYGHEHEIIPNRAQGYNFNQATGQITNDDLISMNTPGAAGALIASAGDLVRWQIALRSGLAVQPESYQQMISSTVATGQGAGEYGFGLMIAEANGVRSIAHGGGIPGFNSVLTTLPDLDMHVAVISNSNGLVSDVVAASIVGALTSEVPPPLPEQRTTAHPDSERALREMIAGLVSGEPDYDSMSPQLAEVTRTQLPGLQQRLQSLGAIESIGFLAVGAAGQDIYEVGFRNGALIMQILMGPDGRVASAAMRPAPPPE